ncbi:hypothetical protein [Lactobacillus helveticus]|uniref:hypothetical protein n=3 Tax=Lactobacillus helveticus TaxID=1587 RepID=UPI001566047B|nr:hypothetical protein [Lactobacillus helveticus]NRO19321.1 hypothetical protein [Lactobacillus helveticus]
MNIVDKIEKVYNSLKKHSQKIINMFHETELYKQNSSDDRFIFKFDHYKFILFIICCLFIYPIVLVGLLELIIQNTTIFKILQSLITAHINLAQNKSFGNFISLTSTVYQMCFAVCLLVSIIWIQISTSFDIDSKLIIKVLKNIITIVLLVVLILFWGRVKVDAINKQIFNMVHHNLALIELLILNILYSVVAGAITWLTSSEINKKSSYSIKNHVCICVLGILGILLGYWSHFLLGIIIILLMFGIAILQNFDKTLLSSGFIGSIGFIVVTSGINENSTISIEGYSSIIIAYFICEWIISKINLLKKISADKDEEEAVKSVLKATFGSSIGGSIIILILSLIKRLL